MLSGVGRSGLVSRAAWMGADRRRRVSGAALPTPEYPKSRPAGPTAMRRHDDGEKTGTQGQHACPGGDGAAGAWSGAGSWAVSYGRPLSGSARAGARRGQGGYRRWPRLRRPAASGSISCRSPPGAATGDALVSATSRVLAVEPRTGRRAWAGRYAWACPYVGVLPVPAERAVARHRAGEWIPGSAVYIQPAGLPPREMITVTAMMPTASRHVEVITHPRAVRDAATAPCWSPASQVRRTRRE